MRWFRRRWLESRGDDFAVWGAATFYFEVGPDGWPERQIEIYDDGPTLRYGPEHPEDDYGGLGQARLDEFEEWTEWAITKDQFTAAWTA